MNAKASRKFLKVNLRVIASRPDTSDQLLSLPNAALRASDVNFCAMADLSGNQRRDPRKGSRPTLPFIWPSRPYEATNEAPMSWSLNIGSVAGTVVRVHLTFLLFLAWIFAASYSSRGAATAWDSLIFMV